MKLKLLSWNVHGLNDKDKRLRIWHLLKIWGLDIIYLQETNLDLVTRGIVHSVWGVHHID